MSKEAKHEKQIRFNIYNNLTDFEDNFLDDFEDSDLSERHFVNYLTENYEQTLKNLTKTEIYKPKHFFLETNLVGVFFNDNDVKDLRSYRQGNSFVYITNERGEIIAHVYKPLIDFFNEKNQLDLFSYRELIDNLELIIKRLKEIRLKFRAIFYVLSFHLDYDQNGFCTIAKNGTDFHSRLRNIFVQSEDALLAKALSLFVIFFPGSTWQALFEI